MSQTDALIEYATIIQYRRRNPFPQDEYGEIHHIRPKSCDGSNDDCNLIRLSPEEHYRAHFLLTHIFDTGEYHRKMVCAWFMMSKEGKYDISQYGNLRREFSAYMSELKYNQSEETKKKISISMTGRKFTEEHKRKISESNKGVRHSEETRRKMSEAKKHQSEETKRKISETMKRVRLGVKQSEETKRKISEKLKGRTVWNKGIHWKRKKDLSQNI